MSNKLSRQYGLAASSSLTPVLHPEDLQPNERGSRGNQKAPPRISVTSAPRGGHNGGHIRGGYRGPVYRGGPFTQYAVRGNSSWRERGRGRGSSTRGTSRPPNTDQYRQPYMPTPRSSSSKQPLVHWSRQEGASTWNTSNGVLEASTSTVAAVNVTSSYRSAVSTDTGIVVHPSSRSDRPSLPSRPPMDRPKHPVPSKSHPGLFPVQETELHIESINRSATKPVEIPEWLLRSRSPSPKLPPSPLKRRKIAHDFTSQTLRIEPPLPSTPMGDNTTTNHKRRIPLPGRSVTTSVAIKEEPKVNPEPTPPVKQEVDSPPRAEPSTPVRKLTTESTNFYATPANCKKSNPDFAQNRRSYFSEKVRELRRLGLQKTKAFWRDDGLVIEWSSTMPVWSDTLKPDIPDLATAIKRANELNNMNLPKSPKRKKTTLAGNDTSSAKVTNTVQSTPKRTKSGEPVASDIVSTSNINNMEETETVTSAPKRKKGEHVTSNITSINRVEVIDLTESVWELPKKKLRKHWAAGISSGELHRSANLSPQLPEQNTSKRLSLPTRLLSVKPPSTSSDPTPFTVPDPSAALPSQEWRTAASKADTSASRLIFKPSNPRKSQGTAEKVLGTALTEAHDINSRESENGIKIAQRFSQNVHPSSARMSHESTSIASMVLQVSRPPTPRERSTPEPARSPTLVNESMSETNTHTQIEVSRNNASGLVDPLHNADDKGGDRGQYPNLDSIALDLMHNTIDLADMDMSSDDGESVDEETEDNVKQFISKYATMFDSDRRSLKKAYAKNALFSCRIHDAKPNSCASLFIPEGREAFRSTHSSGSASRVIRGRTQICDELISLGQYQFIPRGVPQNYLYTWSIPKCSEVQDGILLSLHGEVVKTEADPAMDHRLTVDQIFLLRQRTDDDDTDDNDGTDVPGQTHMKNFWPLAAVSHQMTARSIPLLDTENSQTRLEWVGDILQ